MLSRKENLLNVLCLALLARLNALPLSVDIKKARIQLAAHPRGYRIWLLIVITVQVYTIYLAAMLLLNVSRNGLEDLQSRSMDLILILPFQMSVIVSVQSLVHWPSETVLVCRILATTENEIASAKRKFPVGYSLLDLFTMFLPCNILLMAFVLITTYEISCTWPSTVLFGLALRVTLVFLESSLLLCSFSWLYFSVLLLVIFMEKVNVELKSESAKLR